MYLKCMDTFGTCKFPIMCPSREIMNTSFNFNYFSKRRKAEIFMGIKVKFPFLIQAEISEHTQEKPISLEQPILLW